MKFKHPKEGHNLLIFLAFFCNLSQFWAPRFKSHNPDDFCNWKGILHHSIQWLYRMQYVCCFPLLTIILLLTYSLLLALLSCLPWGPFKNYLEKMRGEGVKKCLFFVHAQGIKTVHAGGRGVKKWQNSVHVVVECPLENCTDK